MKSLLYQQSIISIDQLSNAQIEQVLDLAGQYKTKGTSACLSGRLIVNCFYEPSTRTRLSFESAAIRLGAQVIGFADANTSSHKKGESLQDTLRVTQHYGDAVVLRHPKEGAAKLAAEVANVPVINAGDGANQHPTQALLDLFTIQECHPEKKQRHIVFMGDLRHGRTVNSLARACRLFDSRLYFVSDPGLALPNTTAEMLKRQGVRFSFHANLADVIPKADIVYVTRLQKERLLNGRYTEPFKMTLEDLAFAKPDLRILHPLPRVDEIDLRIDDTPHAYYFQQAENGLYVRQALLALILNETV